MAAVQALPEDRLSVVFGWHSARVPFAPEELRQPAPGHHRERQHARVRAVRRSAGDAGRNPARAGGALDGSGLVRAQPAAAAGSLQPDRAAHPREAGALHGAHGGPGAGGGRRHAAARRRGLPGDPELPLGGPSPLLGHPQDLPDLEPCHSGRHDRAQVLHGWRPGLPDRGPEGRIPGRAERASCSTRTRNCCGPLARPTGYGKPVAIHAIGDRAIEQVLGVLERLDRDGLSFPLVRLEHVQFIDQAQARRAKDLGLVLSMQPNFNSDSQDYADRLAPRWLERNNPFRMLIDQAGFEPGQDLIFGSDGMPHGDRIRPAVEPVPALSRAEADGGGTGGRVRHPPGGRAQRPGDRSRSPPREAPGIPRRNEHREGAKPPKNRRSFVLLRVSSWLLAFPLEIRGPPRSPLP